VERLLKLSLCVSLMFLVVSLPVQGWDFQSPEERPVRGTAFTGSAGQKRLVVGFYGTQIDELLATLGLTYSPFRFWEFGMNFAHLGIGAINITTKFNLLDKNGWGIGMSAGFAWAHGDWMWVLPPFQRHLAQGIDVFLIPVNLIGSFEPLKWLHFDLALSFVDAEVLGRFNGSRLFYEGDLGARRVDVQPAVRFFVWDRVSFNVAARLPMWGQVYRELAAELDITSGIRGGVRSTKLVTLKPLYTWLVTPGISVEMVRRLLLTVNIAVGPTSEAFYSNQVNVGLDIEWRF
jgi:hypothetical protein